MKNTYTIGSSLCINEDDIMIAPEQFSQAGSSLGILDTTLLPCSAEDTPTFLLGG